MKKLLRLFLMFFKIGIVTVGGGLVMLPFIEREICTKNGWIEQEKMRDIFAVSQAMPGIMVINVAVYTGFSVAGVVGAVVAMLGTILPSIITILPIAMIFPTFADNVYVGKALAGIRVGMAAVLLVMGIDMLKRYKKDHLSLAVMAVVFVMILFVPVNVIWIILLGGVYGVVVHKFKNG